MCTLTVQRELPKYNSIRVSIPYLRTKNETMAPLHVATLTVYRELPNNVFSPLPNMIPELDDIRFIGQDEV